MNTTEAMPIYSSDGICRTVQCGSQSWPVSHRLQQEFVQALADSGKTWDQFLAEHPFDPKQQQRASIQGQLAASDAGQSRVVDDILDYLISGTPLPKAALDKLAARKVLREQLKGLQ